MSASQLLDRIEETGLVDPKTLAKLRREVAAPGKAVKASAVAKYLIEKGHMTKAQVDRLMAAIKEANEELTVADVPAPRHAHNTDELTNIGGTTQTKPTKPVPGQAIEGLTEIVPVEFVDDGTRVYGIDEVLQQEGAIEVAVDVERTRMLGDAADPFGAADGGLNAGGLFGEAMPAAATEEAPQPTSFRGKLDTSNQWQTKWLFIGFGLLAILVLSGAVLILALAGESADKLWERANDSFTKGAFLDAAKNYKELYTKFPNNEHVDAAKVHEVWSLMAEPFERKRYTEVLTVATEHLPKIVDLDAMEDFRPDLALQLCTLAVAESEEALKKTTQPEMVAALEQVQKAKALVDNLAYVSASVKKVPPYVGFVERLENNVKLITGTIEKERDYAATLAKIRELAAKSETDAAFGEYFRLTRSYGDMAARSELREAMKEVSTREMGLVKPSELTTVTATTEVPTAVTGQVLMSATTGTPIESLVDDILPVLSEGAVYGVNAGDGALIWRRHVGYQTMIQPRWVDQLDKQRLIVCDQNRQEVACLEGRTGQLIWRTQIGQEFFAPTMIDDTLYVSTRSGIIVRLDPHTGQQMATAQLPKRMLTAVEKPEGIPYVYAVAEDSNLYILSAEDLTCKEVFYLGHFKGSVSIAPVYWSGHLLVAVNGSDSSDLHVLKFVDKGMKTERVQVIRLAQGTVSVAPNRLGRWMLFLADNGEVSILELNTTEAEVPVRKLAEEKFENRGRDRFYMLAEGSDLWVASKGINRYRIQRTLGQFERQSLVNHADFFLGPLAKIDTHLFHLRRRDGAQQVSVSAVDSQTLAEIWRTDFGAPTPAAPIAEGNDLTLVTSQGDAFRIDSATLERGFTREPLRASDIDQALTFVDQVPLDASRSAWVGPAGLGDVLVLDLAARDSQLSRMQAPADQPACTPIGIGSDLLVPSTKGQIVRVDPANGRVIGNPFQPSLRPGQETRWNRPVRIGNGAVLVGDRERTVYAIDSADRSALKELARLVVEGELISDFAGDGKSAFAVMEVSGNHRLVRFDLNTGIEMAATVELPARAVEAPRVLDDRVFVALEDGQLHTFDTNCQAGWTLDLQNQRLAGLVSRGESGWDVALVSGQIHRLDRAGAHQQTLEIGQPIRLSPVLIGSRLFVSAADGTLLVLDPSKL